MCECTHTLAHYTTQEPIAGELKRNVTVHVDPFSEFTDLSAFSGSPSFHHPMSLSFLETQTKMFTRSCSVLKSGRLKVEETGYFQLFQNPDV